MIVITENLGKRFNREWIFRNFNYSFQPGVYAITGPNGSGKSTLLSVLWGQVPSSSGSVTYQQAQQHIPVEEIYKQVAIAAPYMELIEEFTLDEILRFHFSFKKIRGGRRLEELIGLLELTHARDKMITHFSSGMKQRLKLGLAFFSDVEAIFLDEPTTNLDKQSVEWYWRNFNQLPAETLVLIGSNLENEYPENALKIQLTDYK
jgi:ABC-type multidrug transport system ATPase subunit